MTGFRYALRSARVTALLCGLTVLLTAGIATGQDDLTELLEQVGADYAEYYMLPFTASVGANQNSCLFTTAAIPKSRLTVNIGLKVMVTSLNDDDKTFSKSRNISLDETWGIDPGDPLYGQQATIYMNGPTVFGQTDDPGSIRVFHTASGLEVAPPHETIEGLADWNWVPLFTPEISVGGVAGLRATIRWLPDMEMGDLGTFKYLGYGLQYNANAVLPMLPVDVMAGFFNQNLEVGDSVETNAHSYFIAVSKGFTMATVYGGLAIEESEIDIAYTFEGYDGTPRDVSFSYEAEQTKRLTLGATVNLGARINFEMGVGKLVNYSAGMMFGF